MRTVPSPAGIGIDRCGACGAAWFDPGEIRELAEGRYPPGEETVPGDAPTPADGEGAAARMSRAWKEAASLSCARCSARLAPVDFRATGIPVFRCRECGGMLVPRGSVAALARRFGFQRRNAALYEALGESMAGEVRERMERKFRADGTAGGGKEAGAPGLPLVVPLADGAPPPDSMPLATWGLLGVTVLLHVLAAVDAWGMGGLTARLALPPGKGFGALARSALLMVPFFHGGFVPLAVGCLFLFVLGDNVEDRMGHVPFLLFYLFCGAVAGAAHVIWGKAGMPPALGAAGAVAGVLGAYLVFFPEVPISMYGMGEVTPVPAYLFACAWAVAVFLWGWGPGPLSALLNPAPYTLPGHLAGFSAGVAGGSLWRSFETAGSSGGTHA